MKQKWLATVLLSLTSGITLFGCDQKEVGTGSTDGEPEISVVTSFYPMYEFTQHVAGDRADIKLMVSAGEDAHHYEPSAQDVAAVSDADVFVYSSEEMEFWVESLLNTVENDDLVIVRTADRIDFVNTSGAGHGREDEEDQEVTESVVIHGVLHHYHTGDTIELTAELDKDVDYDHWHWYTRESANDEWATVSGQGTSEFEFEATGKSFEVRAVLFDDAHNAFAQSEPTEIVIEDHGHDEEDGHHQDYDEDDSHHNGHDNDKHEHGNGEGAPETVEIVGLADHYHTGDVVTLAAKLDEEVNYNHWHWYTRESR